MSTAKILDYGETVRKPYPISKYL